jgi:hypothetical protein
VANQGEKTEEGCGVKEMKDSYHGEETDLERKVQR